VAIGPTTPIHRLRAPPRLWSRPGAGRLALLGAGASARRSLLPAGLGFSGLRSLTATRQARSGRQFEGRIEARATDTSRTRSRRLGRDQRFPVGCSQSRYAVPDTSDGRLWVPTLYTRLGPLDEPEGAGARVMTARACDLRAAAVQLFTGLLRPPEMNGVRHVMTKRYAFASS